MYMQDGKQVIPYGRRNPGASKLDVLDLLDKINALEERVKALESGASDQTEPAKRGRKPKEATE